MSIRFSPFLVGLPLILTLSFGLCVATAQESPPDIGALQVENDRAELSLSGNATSYYILYRSEDLQSFAPVGGKLGADAALILLDESLLPAKAFYRVQAVPMDTPLDTDGDGIDDVYELLHPAILDPLDPTDADDDPDNDGLTTLEEYLVGSDPESGDGISGPTTFASSPGNGADDVAVTRETILRFSRPLKAAPRDFAVRAEASGNVLRTRIHTSPDLRTVTLFYPDGLPGSASVKVTLNPAGFIDAEDRMVDLDADGQPGGFGVIEFRTLSLTALPGTAVIGRVFASELGDEGVNTPLSGVVVTVDGREGELRAVTNAMGNFRLDPAPAGHFFVHVDGRTARGELPAGGAYYPFVGKSWHAAAGEETNIGEVYLPLVREGTLREVSETETTEVTFAASVLADNPELEGVKLEVPPDSLYADNGARGGMVGIAPVDPARLPGRLPEDLKFPLVITVQTDGPSNFDQPVPACFPNLPNERTGRPLPAGSKSALWSFNHDTGRFEIVGPMTVSADGRFVCTDPGVGIRAPGWHGTDPGAEGRDGDIEEEDDEDGPCDVGDIEIAYQANGFFIFRVSTPGFRGQVRWTGPGGSPDGEIGNVYRTQFCEAGAYTITAFLVKRGEREPCASVSRQVTLTDDDLAPDLTDITMVSAPEGGVGVFHAGSSTVGSWAWSVEPSEDASVASETLANEERASTSEISFCKAGTYTVSAVFTDLCGRAWEHTPITVTVPEGAEPKVTLLANLSRENDLLMGMTSNTPGKTEWSIEPSEDVVIERSDTRSETHPLAAPQYGSLLTGRFCKAGSYTVRVRYTPDHCDAEPITETTVVTGVEPKLKQLFDLSLEDNFRLFVTTNAPGPTEWSIEPREDVILEQNETRARENPLGSPDLVSELSGFFCKAGTYTVRVRYTPDHCEVEPMIATKTITVTEEEVSGCGGEALPVLEPQALPQEVATRPVEGRFYALVTNLSSGFETRRSVGSKGVAFPDGLRLSPDADYEGFILDASTLRVAQATWRTPGAGRSFELPSFLLEFLVEEPDSDLDGLHDLAERIMGTDPDNPDSDNDGIFDGPEVLQGLDPLDGIPTRVGILASLDLPGTMKDVCTAGDLAVTANGNAGVSLINIFNGLDPVEIARIDTPGDAQAIACVDGYIAVADGSAGLAIIRLGDPADTSALTRQLSLGDAVSVEAGAGLAYVGLANGFVVAVDLESGLEAARFRPSGASPIDDLTFGGDVLYAVNAESVMALDPFGGAAGLVGQINHRGREGAGNRRFRLFAGRDVLYSVHSQGYNTYDFGESGVPQLIADGQNSGAFGWKQIVTNGTGLGIAAVGVNSTADGAHHISLYDVTNPANTNVFVERIETPGLAAALELSNGLIYVADSEAGLQVVNYLPFDTGDQPPTLTLSTNFAEGVAEENALLTLTADVTDDVQVRTVDFFVEGQKVDCDGSFPFQYRLRVPPRAEQPMLAVGALATDTGGNVSSLAELNLTVTEDATPPGVRLTIPQDGSRVGSRREFTLSVHLNEPVTESSALAEGSFQLVGAGADNSFDTADDVFVDGEVRYVDGSDLLRFVPGAGILPGLYRATIGDQLVDLSGNRRTDSFSWNFIVSAPHITSRFPGIDGVVRPFSLSTVDVVFSGEIDGAGTGSDTLQLIAAGPDGALETADDVRLPGDVRFQLERPDQLSFDLVTQFGLGFGLYQVVLADVPDWTGASVPGSRWSFVVDGAVETAVIGRVIDEAGNGIAGVSVAVDNADQAAVSAADGTFRIESALVSQISSVFAVSQGGQEVGSKPVGDAHPSRASEVGDVVLMPFSLPLPRAAAGEEHSLVIDPGGRLSGWGINATGEIGDGTMQERFLPSPVAGGARWKTVVTPNRAASEANHSLGIQMDGSLWAWGGTDLTEKGLLGIGTRGTVFNEPQPIASDQGWISVGATREHVLGVKEDGTLWAWGENGAGQLGTGDTEERAIPTQIGSDSDWQMVAAGFHTGFALKTDGSLWSWGENLQGALGLGDTAPRREPTRVGDDKDWILVAAGDASNYVVGIKSDLTLWHWGPAVEPHREILSPERLDSSVGWRGANVGERHVLGIKVDGSLWGWRSARQEGIIGPGIPGSIGEPQLVSPVRGWRDAAVGEDQNVAIHDDGRVISWGESIYLGVEGLEDRTVYGFQDVRLPVMATLTGRVENADGDLMEGVFVSVDTRDPVLTNAEGAFALDDVRIPTGATLYATRYEASTETRFLAEMVIGEIAEGETRDLGVVVGHPFGISALRPTLACAEEHAFAIKANGTLWAWGENNDRAVLGDPDLITDADAFDFRQPVPGQIGLDTDWVSVNSRDDHTVALKENGTLWAWGRGSNGELGFSELRRAETPAQVGNETDWAQAVTGEFFTLALKTDGSLWAWGRNREGQLGNGSTTVSVVPVRVGADSDWAFVAAGQDHSVALKTDGTLWTWGDNEFSKLGDGTDAPFRTVPAQIGGERDWVFIAAGQENTYAIKANGTVWGWGENDDGLMGSGDSNVREFSTPVKLFDGVWISVSFYRRHAVALRADGTLWGWGNNRGGELLGADRPFEFTNPVRLQPNDNWVRGCAGDEYSIGLTNEGELWSWGNNSDGVLGRPDVDMEPGPFPAGSLAEKDWRATP